MMPPPARNCSMRAIYIRRAIVLRMRQFRNYANALKTNFSAMAVIIATTAARTLRIRDRSHRRHHRYTARDWPTIILVSRVRSGTRGITFGIISVAP